MTNGQESRARTVRLAQAARVRKLSRANAELQELTSVLAHDLQEPLRTIMNCARLLRENTRGRLDRQSRAMVLHAEQGARRASRLITDLLAYSRAGSDALSPRLVDSSMAFLGATAGLRAAIQEGRALVTSGRLPSVMADQTQLAQVFQNLVANALKFRGAAPPRVHVSARRRGSAWVFTVRDNGRGFDPALARGLFNGTLRLEPGVPGEGIGLALCKRIVERHGGRIWASSEPGKGASFSFSLPSGRNVRGGGFA